MAFTEQELADIRRFCGYAPSGKEQHDLLLTFKINYLTKTERAVVRRYLATLATLADVIAVDRGRPETERLFTGWRRRLCGFLGIPPGPGVFAEAPRVASPMTDPAQEAVRRACETATTRHPECSFPACDCQMAERQVTLATLIAQARVEGAAEERERAVQACSAIGAKYTEKKPALATVAWECCEAIRARKEETK